MKDGIFVSFDNVYLTKDQEKQVAELIFDLALQNRGKHKEITEVETSMKELEGKLESLRMKLNELKK